MSALDDFMRPRVRIKRLTLTVPEARVVERALRHFEPMSRDDKTTATLLADRLKMAKLERGKAREGDARDNTRDGRDGHGEGT